MSSPIKSLHDPLYRGDVEWGPSAGGYAEPVLPDLLAHVAGHPAVQYRNSAEHREGVVDSEAGVVQDHPVEYPVAARDTGSDTRRRLEDKRHAGEDGPAGKQRVILTITRVRCC